MYRTLCLRRYAVQFFYLGDINEHRERLWRLVSRLGKGLGGATFVVADLAAAAAIGQAYALVSTTVGTTLLGMALRDEKPK